MVHLKPQDSDLAIPLKEGDFFGETELVSGRCRNVTVIAGQNCILVETPRHAIRKLTNYVESVGLALNEAAIKRAIQWYLAPEVTENELALLVAACQCKSYAQGDALFQKGDSGDSIHFIRGGSVTVSHDSDGQELAYRFITSGDYLGEWAVLTDSKRIATARTTSATETVEIQGTAFKTLLKTHPGLRRHAHLNCGMAFANDNII